MKYRIRFILTVITAAFFAGSFLNGAKAQKVFSHLTPEHKDGKYRDCVVCHDVPTRNWVAVRRDKSEPFPDVRNYPYNRPDTTSKDGWHNSCIECHKSDFNKAGFCADCHGRNGPNLSAKIMRPFPNKAHGTEFITLFPHNLHQDVIASNERNRDVAVGHFVLASFSRPIPDDKKNEFYNCSQCHKTATVTPKWELRKPVTDEKPPVAQKDIFKPKANYFKDVPTNHASCFTCHYQRIKPVSTDCSGCHIFADKRYIASDVVKRSSLKFGHEELGKKVQVGERVHAKDCMTCHLRTASSRDLQLLKNKKEPEVPFSTCVSCHADDIKDQFEKREKDAAFQCTYCHTSEIGRFKKPESHRE